MKPLSTIAAAAAIVAILTAPAVSAERFYIPLGSDNAIVAIDPAEDEVVGRIDGVPAVHGLAVTPDERFLVAGSFDERQADAMAPEKPSGMAEDEHAAHHSKGAAMRGGAAASVVSTVSIIDIETASVVRRVDVPGAVHHVSIDPTGRFAALTQPNQDAVTILDLANIAVAATIVTGPLPNYAVFSPDGQRLYVSNAGNNTVSDIAADSWIVLRNVIVGESPEHVVLSADGKTLYVNNIDGGTVSEIDTASWSVGKTIEAGELLHGIDLSDDGKTIFVAVRGGDFLTAIDLQSGASKTITLSPSPYHLAAVRGLGKIYISSAEEPKVWVVDQQTLSVSGEMEIGGKGHQMVQVSR
jgi:YVTN family beta-propeller protein